MKRYLLVFVLIFVLICSLLINTVSAVIERQGQHRVRQRRG